MTDIPTLPTDAGELAALALVKLIETAIAPVIDQKILESEQAYNLTFQTHLEIMQAQGRRIDALRAKYNELNDRFNAFYDELSDLGMRHRLANTKLQSLDGARAGHQNHIAELFDLVGQLQSAMTEAEAAIADLEDPAPIEPPPPQPADTSKPFAGIFAGLGKLTPEQLRSIMPEQPSLFVNPAAQEQPSMATAYTHTGDHWLKTFDGPRITIRTYGSKGITFNPVTGVAQTASSDTPPASCADTGKTCCGCNPCCNCGKLR